MRVYTVIFEADTRGGPRFDLLLVATILASVLVVILDSVQSITARCGPLFDVLEWGFTFLFTVEGDITPKTDLGRFIASCMMLMGWDILADPTGIVTAEMTVRRIAPPVAARKCRGCLTEGHDADARYCKRCGKLLAVENPG